MRLTGKAKEEFEKWYLKDVSIEENYGQHVINSFYALSSSMQYGVLVNFFDSVGIEISVTPVYPIYKYGYSYSIGLDTNFETYTRLQAREQAVTKAVEILNNRK